MWQRFSLGPRPAERNATIGIRLARVQDSLDIAFPQIEDVTGYDEGGQVPAEYVSVGVLFFPYNISDHLTSFDRDLATDIALGSDTPGVKLREWNKRDIEDILGRTVPGIRALRPRAIVSNAGIGQRNPIRGSSGTEIQGQYNINWVNSGLIDYVIPWDYAHPIPAADWTYKNALLDRRRGTVMGGLYHGRKPAEPVLLESIMPAILADDGDMAALYPYWRMSDKQARLLRSRYFQLPARIPWRTHRIGSDSHIAGKFWRVAKRLGGGDARAEPAERPMSQKDVM